MEDNKVVGVVTRTDLINVFANASGHLPEHKGGGKERSLAKLIQDRLPASTRDLLHLAGRLGAARGLPVYAVGGFVRDLLLQRPNQDIDLVVEGDGLALARELARELGGRVREHRKFLTSMVIFPDAQGQEQRLDVATARLEYYEHPAALPTVELSSLKMDLFRRDFSINALAVRLDDPFGLLVDFFGGQRDIKDKVIRVLHTLSFVEDPTRCRALCALSSVTASIWARARKNWSKTPCRSSSWTAFRPSACSANSSTFVMKKPPWPASRAWTSWASGRP